MCNLCLESRHIPEAASIRRECYEEYLALRREEARHSDIPNGMGRAVIDAHPFSSHYDLWRLSWQLARDQDWIRARMARLRSMWQPTRTEQTFLD